jgi:hypothetical protein
VGLIAPADELLPRTQSNPLGKLKERGTISFCRPDALDRDAADLAKEGPPRQRFTRAGISVTEFVPWKLPNGVLLYRAYFRTDKEAMMINDPNPDLWKVMLEVAEKAKTGAPSR